MRKGSFFLMTCDWLQPPFKTARWLGALTVSYLFGVLVMVAIPEDEVNGVNFRHLMVLIPLFISYGNYHTLFCTE